LTEIKQLIQAEAERQAQAVKDLEANQRDFEVKKQKHKEAVASIAAEQKKMEDLVKATLEQQQAQWAEEEAELDRQLTTGASESQEFLDLLLKQKQDAEDLHRETMDEKKRNCWNIRLRLKTKLLPSKQKLNGDNKHNRQTWKACCYKNLKTEEYFWKRLNAWLKLRWDWMHRQNQFQQSLNKKLKLRLDQTHRQSLNKINLRAQQLLLQKKKKKETFLTINPRSKESKRLTI
jgi:hypothetical protein